MAMNVPIPSIKTQEDTLLLVLQRPPEILGNRTEGDEYRAPVVSGRFRPSDLRTNDQKDAVGIFKGIAFFPLPRGFQKITELRTRFIIRYRSDAMSLR